jgi:hypothetical protein
MGARKSKPVNAEVWVSLVKRTISAQSQTLSLVSCLLVTGSGIRKARLIGPVVPPVASHTRTCSLPHRQKWFFFGAGALINLATGLKYFGKILKISNCLCRSNSELWSRLLDHDSESQFVALITTRPNCIRQALWGTQMRHEHGQEQEISWFYGTLP